MIAQQYESQKVLSASPMELILMLYDGGIRSLNQALDALAEGDDINSRNRFSEQLLQAQSYITELTCSLDVERGGEMAVKMERLYDFMLNHLMEANTGGHRQPVADVKRLLDELRDGWAQAMAAIPNEPSPEPIPVERKSSFCFAG